jgi:hypothetical protein
MLLQSQKFCEGGLPALRPTNFGPAPFEGSPAIGSAINRPQLLQSSVSASHTFEFFYKICEGGCVARSPGILAPAPSSSFSKNFLARSAAPRATKIQLRIKERIEIALNSIADARREGRYCHNNERSLDRKFDMSDWEAVSVSNSTAPRCPSRHHAVPEKQQIR